MIKLKHLIKEETIHSCECGGDCCSVNDSKGMEFRRCETRHRRGASREHRAIPEKLGRAKDRRSAADACDCHLRQRREARCHRRVDHRDRQFRHRHD